MSVFLLLCLMLLSLALSSWTTTTSAPSFGDGTIPTWAGQFAFFVRNEITHRYSFPTDSWTTLPSRPISREKSATAATSPSSIIVFGGETTPGSRSKAAHELTTTGTWKTISDYPNLRTRLGCCTDDNYVVWAGGGNDPSGDRNQVFSYQPTTDVWAAKRRLPTARSNLGISCLGNFVYASGGVSPPFSTHERYDVTLDVWTSLTSVPVAYTFNGRVVTIGSELVYYSDGCFLSYSPYQDVWTTFGSAPSLVFSFVALGSKSPTVKAILTVAMDSTTHIYAYPIQSSVVGDPLFTSLGGVSKHYHMRAGVFNLLTTSSVVVNAVFEPLSSLPAEENTVIVMVGLVFYDDHFLTLVDCEATQFQCVQQAFALSANQNTSFIPSFSLTGSAVEMRLADFAVKVLFRASAVVGAGSSHAQWLDVVVSGASGSARGLLADIHLASDLAVDDYEVVSGCVFATNIFGAASPIPYC